MARLALKTFIDGMSPRAGEGLGGLGGLVRRRDVAEWKQQSSLNALKNCSGPYSLWSGFAEVLLSNLTFINTPPSPDPPPTSLARPTSLTVLIQSKRSSSPALEIPKPDSLETFPAEQTKPSMN